eukprot:g49530.t1
MEIVNFTPGANYMTKTQKSINLKYNQSPNPSPNQSPNQSPNPSPNQSPNQNLIRARRPTSNLIRARRPTSNLIGASQYRYISDTAKRNAVNQAASNFLLSTSYNLVLQFFPPNQSNPTNAKTHMMRLYFIHKDCHAKNKKISQGWRKRQCTSCVTSLVTRWPAVMSQALFQSLADNFLAYSEGKTPPGMPDGLIKTLESVSGASLDKPVRVNGLGGDWTPLALAVKGRRSDVIQKMIDRRCDINALDSAGYSALLGAAMAGREDEARLLCANNVDVNKGAASGKDSMYYACATGAVGLVKLLVLSGGKLDSGMRGCEYALSKLGAQSQGRIGPESGFKNVVKANVEEINKFLEGDAKVIQSKPKAEPAPASSAAKAATGAPDQKHDQGSESKQVSQVMISYCWADQQQVLRLRDEMQSRGYKVWIDVEQMQGSILSAMADALENSAVVLMCISDAYSKSANCRLEAEYCMKLKKPLIPLMMQQGYNPTGWLGITLGSKLYYMLHDPNSVKQKVNEFKSTLDQFTSPSKAVAVSPAAGPAAPARPDASSWDSKKLQDHLNKA